MDLQAQDQAETAAAPTGDGGVLCSYLKLREDMLRALKVLLIGLLLIVLPAGILFGNFHGWRARFVWRLLRTENPPIVVPRPSGVLPRVPTGFSVQLFAAGFETPRWLAVAPNGDIFVADSSAGKIVVLHEQNSSPRIVTHEVFADQLRLPFGIAFLNQYVYVANTDEVVRFRYDVRTSKRLSEEEHILDLPGLGYNQHWTRSLAFARDGSTLFVSVGSRTNVSIEPDPRGTILAVNPDGTNSRVFARGLRNAVGLAVNDESGELWATVNERDDAGDDAPSDFFTRVLDGGFYGWPYSFLGPHVEQRVAARPDLVSKAIVPDVLLGAHVAPLQFAFYNKEQFPASYRHGAFIAQHGSWNRQSRVGYDVIFVPFHNNGTPVGGSTSVLSGFMVGPSNRNVYGRPVGVAVKKDGSLLVSDDGANVIWEISSDQQPSVSRQQSF
jgi:glucose/arabinose dehydrogenase